MSPGPVVEIDLRDINISSSALHRDALAILGALQLGAVELSILICSDDFIQELNRDYRGLDKPTDVLSFAQREGEGADPDDPVLGDVVISIDTARRQAAHHDHSLEVELRVLLIHGVLHLLGYDHILASDAAQMREAEQRLLDGLSTDANVALTVRENP